MTTFLETFEAPHLGMDTESAPNRLGKGYCRQIVNALTGRPGRVTMRGGLDRQTALVAPAEVGWPSRTGSILLVKTSTAGTVIDTVAGWASIAATMPSADHIPGRAYAQVGDVVYGISSTGKFLRWDANALVTTKYTNGPTSGAALAYWQNRLWYLGGAPAGGATVAKDRLYWSDLFDGAAPLPDTVAAWSDDVSGLVNQLVLSSISGINQPVGLGVLPNALIVFGTYSADMIFGSSPANATVRSRVLSRGCVDSRTIVPYDGGVLWLAPEGLFYFDGTEEVELSTPVRRDLMVQLTVSKLNPNNSVTAVLLQNDYLLVTIGRGATDSHQWLCHLPTRSWSRFESTALVNGSAFAGAAGSSAYICDGTRIWSLNYVTNPLSFSVVLDPARLFDDGVINALQPVKMSVDGRLAALASPHSKAVITRSAVDSVAHQGNGTLDLRDVHGTSLLAAPVELSGTSDGTRARSINEHFIEANEVAVHVEMVDNGITDASTIYTPELQDVSLEYDQAQKPKSY